MAKPHIEKKFDTIIIEPELDSRMRLKQAMSSVYNFGKSLQMLTLDEGIQKLHQTDPFDVIFISHRFDQASIIDFIKRAKETKMGQDAAYVLVLSSKQQGTTQVAQNVLIGADGFLFEPYSVDMLLDITKLSAAVKADRSAAREKAAINMVVQDLLSQIDQLSVIKANKIDPGTSMRKLKELCGFVQGLDEGKLNLYYESALKSFEEAPVPKILTQAKKYGGASSRLKKRMDEKLLKDLEKQDAERKAAGGTGEGKPT